jgi:hypothetical protein
MTNNKIKKEESGEFWGPPSLPTILACFGYFFGLLGAFLTLLHISFVSFCILGIAMCAIAIRMGFFDYCIIDKNHNECFNKSMNLT